MAARSPGRQGEPIPLPVQELKLRVVPGLTDVGELGGDIAILTSALFSFSLIVLSGNFQPVDKDQQQNTRIWLSSVPQAGRLSISSQETAM